MIRMSLQAIVTNKPNFYENANAAVNMQLKYKQMQINVIETRK